MGVGGSIESTTINGRTFSVASDAEANIKLGGWENEVAANGDGTARLIKTRVPCSIEGLVLDADDDLGDHEYLQSIADGNSFVPSSITLASGAVWQGNLQITGDLQKSTQSATATVNLMGTGKITKQ